MSLVEDADLQFQFTCPSRSTTSRAHSLTSSLLVSIHVPLAEHDGNRLPAFPVQLRFNSRAPRGARPRLALRPDRTTGFNSRAPRGARRPFSSKRYWSFSFNSRAPRGARQTPRPVLRSTISFQFTCPSRSTTHKDGRRPDACGFQFTCPSRSTTCGQLVYQGLTGVSIHVPLAEHDVAVIEKSPPGTCFNSRAPRGARPPTGSWLPRSWKFQFTCPSRSTTAVKRPAGHEAFVSIHVPLAEHDGVKPQKAAARAVSIHVPLAEHDAPVVVITPVVKGFNSRAPRGARPQQRQQAQRPEGFQFTCPSRSTT